MTEGQDLLRQIAAAGERLDPRLSDRDVDRLVLGARRRLRRRAARRVGLVAATAMAGIVATAWLAGGAREPATPPLVQGRRLPIASPAPAPERTLRLADGSIVRPLDPGSSVTVARESVERIELALTSGRSRFEVVPRPERSFSVRAGDVNVAVVGTVFTVERIADRVGVAVERGTVRVEWGVGTRLLQQGESGWFPPLQVSLAVPATQRARAQPDKPRARATPSVSTIRPSPSAPPAGEGAEALLLEADRARLDGHAELGVRLLRRLLREHRGDPRAPLAAFTLGRVLLMELARPAEAAAAFAEVRQLSPAGSFAEDALAREVEAWSQAGQADRAHARALEYVRLYPTGRRVNTVRSLGKVE